MATDNPATRLYARLSKWAVTPSAASAKRHRTVGNDWVTPHLEAIEWALQVRSHLKSVNGDDADDDEFLGAILTAIFTTHGLDTSGQNQRHISTENLRVLRQVGAHWHNAPHVDAPVLAEISSVAAEAISLAESSSYLGDTERHYLLDVANHLQKALLDISVNGVADVHRLANELAGALVVYLSLEGGEEAKQAQTLVLRIKHAIKNHLATAYIAALTGGATATGERVIAALMQ